MRARWLGAALIAVIVAIGFAPSAWAQDSTSATVSRVIDGDTVEVSYPDGTTETVRLIGIDSPESVDPDRPLECGALEAAAELSALLEGEVVQVTTDPSQDLEDQYGRLLAYVDTDAFDAGLEMLRLGLAEVFVFEGQPFTRQDQYEAVQEEAASTGAGVWTACDSDFHLPEETPEDSAENFVRQFYSRITQRQFSLAWNMLAAPLRRQLGPYASWRAGYRRTVGTRVNRAATTSDGSRAVVEVAIRRRDRDACSGRVVARYFRGAWTLVESGDEWSATRMSLRKVGGGEVRRSRSQCPRSDGGGGGGGSDEEDVRCHPSYRPCVPTGRDYDCDELDGPYEVIGPDKYRLDGDGDGIGCE